MVNLFFYNMVAQRVRDLCLSRSLRPVIDFKSAKLHTLDKVCKRGQGNDFLALLSILTS